MFKENVASKASRRGLIALIALSLCLPARGQVKTAPVADLYSAVPAAWTESLRTLAAQPAGVSLGLARLLPSLAADSSDPVVRAGCAPLVVKLEAAGFTPQTLSAASASDVKAAVASARQLVAAQTRGLLRQAATAGAGQDSLPGMMAKLSMLQGPLGSYLPDSQRALAKRAQEQVQSRLSQAQREKIETLMARIAGGLESKTIVEALAAQDAPAGQPGAAEDFARQHSRLAKAQAGPQRAEPALAEPAAPFIVHTPTSVGYLKAMLQNRVLGHFTLLVGEAGTGKNALIYELARLRGKAIKVLSLNEQTEVRDLVVRTALKNGETALVPSALVEAMESGTEVVLDEVDRAPAGVLAGLNHILQFGEVTLPDGRVVKAKKGFYVWATRNPPRPPYRGEQLSGELEDRFSVMTVDYLPEAEEVAVLLARGTGLPEDLIVKLVRAANELRASYRKGLLPRPVSMRALIRTIERLKAYPQTPFWEAFKAGYNVGSVDEGLDEVVRRALDALGLLGPMESATPGPAAAAELPSVTLDSRRLPTGAEVMATALSPDGRYLFAACADQTVRMWDVAAGEVVRTFEATFSDVRSLVPSPDGKSLFGAGGWEVHRWDVETGGLRGHLQGHAGLVSSLAISPDGKRLFSGSDDHTARLWDLETGRTLRVFEGHTGAVNAVALSPDGGRLFTASDDKTARVWDAQSGQELRQFTGHGDAVAAASLSPDGRRLLTAGADKTVRLWDAQSGQELRQFTGHTDRVQAVAVSADGRHVLTGSRDGNVRLYDAQTGQEQVRFEGPEKSAGSVLLSPDGKRLFTGGRDPALRVWDVSYPQEERARSLRTAAGAAVPAEELSIQDGVLSIGEASAPTPLKEVGTSPFITRTKTSIAYLKAMLQNRVLGHFTMLVGEAGTGKNALIFELGRLRGKAIKVLSLNEQTELRDLVVRTTLKNGETVLAPSALVEAMESGTEVVLDEVDRAPAGVLAGLNHILQFGEVTLPDGRVVKAKKGFYVWATRNPPRPPYRGEQLSGELEDRFSVMTVDYLPEAEEAAVLAARAPGVSAELIANLVKAANELRASYRKGLLPRPVSMRALIRTIERLKAYPQTPLWEAFKSGFNVGYLDEGLDAVVRKVLEALKLVEPGPSAWESAAPGVTSVAALELDQAGPRGRDHVASALESPDGQYIYTTDFDSPVIHVWNARNGRKVKDIPGHTDTVWSLAMTEDRNLLVSGGADHLVRLWDAKAFVELHRPYEGCAGLVWAVAMSPDGKRVFAADSQKNVIMWDATTGEVLRRFTGHGRNIRSLAVSPDGKSLFGAGEDMAAHLWDVETGEELRKFEGHSGLIASLAVSPDGRHLFTGSQDQTARMWDTATGQEARRFEGHSDSVLSVALSPDGKHLFTGSDDKTARMWDVGSGAPLRSFEGHTASLNTVSVSRDGRRLLTGSNDQTARVWHIPSEAGLAAERLKARAAPSSAPAPQEPLSIEDGVLRIGEVRAPTPLRELGRSPFITPTPTSVGWLKAMLQNRILGHFTMLVGEAGTGKNALIFELGRLRGKIIKVLSLNEQTELRDLVVRTTLKNGETVLAPSALVEAMEGGFEVVLDEVDRAPAGVLAGLNHILQFGEVTLPDGRVVKAKKGFYVWATRNPPRPPYRGEQLSGELEDRFSVMTVDYLPEAEEAAVLAARGGGVSRGLITKLVKAANELRASYRKGLLPRPVSMRALIRTVERLKAYPQTPVWEAFKSGYNVGYIDEGLEDVVRKTLEALDLIGPTAPAAGAAEVRQFGGGGAGVFATALSPDGRYLFTGPGADGTVRMWDTGTGQELRRFVGHTRVVDQVLVSPDGKYLFTGSWDKTARMWDIATGKELRRFQGHKNWVRALALSPDGKRLFTGSDDKTARMWDVETGQELRRFEGHWHWVRSVALSGDGRQLFTASGDKTARMWDVRTGQELRKFEGHQDSVNAAALSPDGKRLYTGSDDKTARMWDVQTGRELRRFEGHTSRVDTVAASPDGKHLFTGGWDSTARMWDIETGAEAARFLGHSKRVASVTPSPDGKHLLTGSADSTARMWEVPDVQGDAIRALRVQAGLRQDAEGISIIGDVLRIGDVAWPLALNMAAPARGEGAAEAQVSPELLRLLEGLARMLTHEPRLHMAPFKSMGPGDQRTWRMLFDRFEIQFVPEDLADPDPDIPTALTMHELWHLLESRPEVLEAAYKTRTFHSLWNAVEDPRVNSLGRARHPGSRLWLDKLYRKYYGISDLPAETANMGRQPLHLQFGYGLIYRWWKGEDDPRITHPKVLEALQRARADIEAASSDPDAARSYRTIRDRIWPVYQELIEASKEQLKDQKLADGLAQDGEVSVSGQDQDGQGRPLPLDQMSEAGRAKLMEKVREALEKLTPEQRQKLAQQVEDELAQREEDFNEKHGGKLSPRDASERQALERLRAQVAKGEKLDAAGRRAQEELEAQRLKSSGVSAVQEKGFLSYRGLVAAGIATMRAKWQMLFQQQTRKRDQFGRTSGELDEGRLAEAMAGDEAVFRRKLKPGKFSMQVSLLVDLSGSMNRENRYKRAIEGAVLLMESLKDIPGVEFEIVGYKGTEPAVILKAFHERYSLAKAVSAVEQLERSVGGGNGDDEALQLALQRIRARPAGQKIVIMSSDGDPDNNIDRQKFADQIAQASDVFVFGLGIGTEAKVVETLFPQGRSVWAENPAETAQGIYRILSTTQRGRPGR